MEKFIKKYFRKTRYGEYALNLLVFRILLGFKHSKILTWRFDLDLGLIKFSIDNWEKDYIHYEISRLPLLLLFITYLILTSERV